MQDIWDYREESSTYPAATSISHDVDMIELEEESELEPMEISISEEELTTLMETVMEKNRQPESSDGEHRRRGLNLAPHEKYKQRPDVTQRSAKIKINFNRRSTKGQKAKGRFILKMIKSSRVE